MALFTKRREAQIEAKADEIFTARMREFLNETDSYGGPDGRLSFYQVFGTTYSNLYRRNSAFGTVVNFFAQNIGAVHMRLTHRDADGITLPEPDHPVQKLLDHPQKGVPYSRFMRQIVADKCIYDVAAVLKIRENFNPAPNGQGRITNSGAVQNLMRVPVSRLQLTQSSLAAPIEFQVTLDATASKPVKIPADDIIWMPGYSPDANTQGTPPVEQLRQVLAEEWAAGKNQENLWKNGPAVDVVFQQDGSVLGTGLDAGEVERFKESWRTRYGGVSSKNAREWPLLPPGITPRELAIDAKAAEYMATRILAREECCRAFGIQPQLLGITPANFASMDMFHQMLYQDALAPKMVALQEEFEEQLLREFESSDSGYALDFNINAKLMGSFLDQAKIGQQAVGGPWMTRNEFREKFQGLPPIEGGDEIVIPTNVILGGGPQANPQDAQNQNSGGFASVLELREQR